MQYKAFRSAKILPSPALLEGTGHELGGLQTTCFEEVGSRFAGSSRMIQEEGLGFGA